MADIQNEHHNDDGFQCRQCNIFGLLPLGRAVQRCRLVQRTVNAGNTCKVDNHIIAHGFPDLHESQNQRPPFWLRIPHDFIAAKSLNNGVHQTFVRVQKSVDKVADNNPRKEVREEHHRLVCFRSNAAVNLIDKHSQCNRNYNVQYDK